MASTPPTISEAHTSRPWFKKKRYVIPLGLVLLAGFIGSLGDNSPVESSAGENEQEPEAVQQEISEGIMPDYVGYTAREVGATLEELSVREWRVDWPTRFEPRDEEFAEEADDWFVCEQEQQPGEEIDPSKIWLGYGKDCDTYKIVPDLVGLTAPDAGKLARDRGLYIDFPSGRDGDYTVCDQTTPVGTVMPAGLRARDSDEREIELTSAYDCEEYLERVAAQEAEEQQREQERQERAERERILADPNTFEGGRRFINYHLEWLGSDVALIDAYRSWLEAGAVIDDPDSFGGPILDALFGDIPYMPKVTDRMWEEAPDDFQERWDDIRQRLDEADEAHDEAATFRREGVYSISEELPYVADVRALTAEALRLVESIPYPQQ